MEGRAVPHLVPPLCDAVVLLLQVLAENLRFALAPLRLVLPRHHLLQFGIRQLILLPGDGCASTCRENEAVRSSV